MSNSTRVAVIGAGFYGLVIGYKLAEAGATVVVYEAASDLGHGASWANQARVHGGYHYPRDVRTGARSRRGLKKFVNDYGSSIFNDFTMLYGIARHNSKVNTSQFEAFCNRIEAPFSPPTTEVSNIFNDEFISGVYQVEEPAFNSDALLLEARQRLLDSGALLFLSEPVEKVIERNENFTVCLQSGGSEIFNFVLDCTYSNLGTLFEPARLLADTLKIERAEICLVSAPKSLESLGITVMDGPFFSCMPFPTRGSHSFTHVSYTPRRTRTSKLREPEREDSSAFLRMKLDALRYVPAIAELEHQDSIFVDKAILTSSELDDARPVLIHEAGQQGRYLSILGSKIDTVYDAVDSIFSTTELGKVFS
jgi:glycine/D-amino acid oxidase-like deaminating enzyme